MQAGCTVLDKMNGGIDVCGRGSLPACQIEHPGRKRGLTVKEIAFWPAPVPPGGRRMLCSGWESATGEHLLSDVCRHHFRNGEGRAGTGPARGYPGLTPGVTQRLWVGAGCLRHGAQRG